MPTREMGYIHVTVGNKVFMTKGVKVNGGVCEWFQNIFPENTGAYSSDIDFN